MSLPEQYLITTKNLDSFFNALLTAKAPAKFSNKFLEQLDFKSTNDRLFIGVLKLLGFIDSNSVPQEKYFKFLDKSISKEILADSIKAAYSDLFTINIKANEMSVSEVKNKFKTLAQGSKSEKVITLMANTFVALCKYAIFSNSPKMAQEFQEATLVKVDVENSNPTYSNYTHEVINKNITTEMHYNIQIHLPESRDISVYDSIFKSLKDHLL